MTLDFETYYSKEYTLAGKSLNTSEYIRDDRFHIHCVGIKIGTAQTKVYSGTQVPKALKAIDWKNSILICHNTAFDGFILSHHFKIKPAIYACTMSMARGARSPHLRNSLDVVSKEFGLGGKIEGLADTKGKLDLEPAVQQQLEKYCADDVEKTYKIFLKLYDYTTDDEMELIDLTLRMFCDPVLKLDVPRCRDALEKESAGKIAAMMLAGAAADDLMSNDRFADLLLQHLPAHELPKKISPTTGKLVYAFAKNDDGMRALLDHQNTRVRHLAQARLKVKSTINETRAARLLEAGRDDMSLPVLLNYYGAHTGRWSGGGKMNYQNFPRGGEIRKCILAPKGYQIVVVDSAQIEARVVAWLAGQEKLLQAFREKRDVYSEFASVAYGRHIDRKKNPEDALPGFVGKVCTLALGFGMGPERLQHTLKVGSGGLSTEMSYDECEHLVDTYRRENYKIVELWRLFDEALSYMCTGTLKQIMPGLKGTKQYATSYKCLKFSKGLIQLPNHRFLHYYGLHRALEDGKFRFIGPHGMTTTWGGTITENVVQALARVIIADQMRVIAKKYRVVMMTHDEVAFLAKDAQADKALDFALKCFRQPPAWAPDLPLNAEGDFAKEYSK